MDSKRSTPEKALWLTGEETNSLLALVVASPVRLGDVEERVMLKVGELCRAFLREDASEQPAEVTRAPRIRAVRRLPRFRARLIRGQAALVSQASAGTANG